MCLLWLLLQLVVVFLYWDLPPLDKGKTGENSICQSREEDDEQGLEEEDNDEEKPLMRSQELLSSYGSVVTSNPLTNHTPASNAAANHISPPPSPVPPDSHETSSPFKNFSISRGAWLTVSVRDILESVKSSQTHFVFKFLTLTS